MHKIKGKKKLTKGKKKKKKNVEKVESDEDEYDYQKAKIIEEELSDRGESIRKKGKTKKERE